MSTLRALLSGFASAPGRGRVARSALMGMALLGAALTAQASVVYSFTSEFGTFSKEVPDLVNAPGGSGFIASVIASGVFSEPAGCATADAATICTGVSVYTPNYDPDTYVGNSGPHLLFLMSVADLAGNPLKNEVYVALFDPAVATQFGTFTTSTHYWLVNGSQQTFSQSPGSLIVERVGTGPGTDLPEPPSLALLAFGLVALTLRRTLRV